MDIWSALTFENILDTVEKELAIKLNNLCLKRASYINRVYELEKTEQRERFIVKFYRPGRWTKEQILEEHRFVQELSENDIQVIVPLTIKGQTLFTFQNIYWCVYPKKGGRALDEFDKETWLLIGRLMAKMHIIGEKHKETSRLTWRPATATKQHLAVLLDNDHVLPEFQESLRKTTENFINKTDKLFHKDDFLLLHGDCHKGNLIHRPGEGTFFVDFDDICLGPPVQDLWMLLPGHLEESSRELSWFQEGYKLFRDFPESSLELIHVLRGMRLVHFAAWCAVQSTELDFGEHFPEWGTPKYWNSIIRGLQKIGW